MSIPLFKNVFFHTLEKSIKTYRQMAQGEFNKAGYDITMDQSLVLKAIYDYPKYSQQEIAEIVFKDNASLTRIIDLLIKKKYLKRQTHTQDRRRFALSVNDEGVDLLRALDPVAKSNRAKALKGINGQQKEQLTLLLNTIINNCQSYKTSK